MEVSITLKPGRLDTVPQEVIARVATRAEKIIKRLKTSEKPTWLPLAIQFWGAASADYRDAQANCSSSLALHIWKDVGPAVLCKAIAELTLMDGDSEVCSSQHRLRCDYDLIVAGFTQDDPQPAGMIPSYFLAQGNPYRDPAFA